MCTPRSSTLASPSAHRLAPPRPTQPPRRRAVRPSQKPSPAGTGQDGSRWIRWTAGQVERCGNGGTASRTRCPVGEEGWDEWSGRRPRREHQVRGSPSPSTLADACPAYPGTPVHSQVEEPHEPQPEQGPSGSPSSSSLLRAPADLLVPSSSTRAEGAQERPEEARQHARALRQPAWCESQQLLQALVDGPLTRTPPHRLPRAQVDPKFRRNARYASQGTQKVVAAERAAKAASA